VETDFGDEGGEVSLIGAIHDVAARLNQEGIFGDFTIISELLYDKAKFELGLSNPGTGIIQMACASSFVSIRPKFNESKNLKDSDRERMFYAMQGYHMAMDMDNMELAKKWEAKAKAILEDV
jgi:hypothetical protein